MSEGEQLGKCQGADRWLGSWAGAAGAWGAIRVLINFQFFSVARFVEVFGSLGNELCPKFYLVSSNG